MCIFCAHSFSHFVFYTLFGLIFTIFIEINMEPYYLNLCMFAPILFVIFAKTVFDFWIIFSLLYQHASLRKHVFDDWISSPNWRILTFWKQLITKNIFSSSLLFCKEQILLSKWLYYQPTIWNFWKVAGYWHW